MERKLTKIQEIVNHFFESKGLDLDEIKAQAKSGEINYPRHTKPAKDLLELTGSVEKACEAIDKLANWANDSSLHYNLDTVIKKYPELDRLK